MAGCWVADGTGGGVLVDTDDWAGDVFVAAERVDLGVRVAFAEQAETSSIENKNRAVNFFMRILQRIASINVS
jgi:hypothetical protein